jgi:hypothetical protein
VELCDWDVDHMDLQWMFPPSDGGAPILLYKVRYKVFFPVVNATIKSLFNVHSGLICIFC